MRKINWKKGLSLFMAATLITLIPASAKGAQLPVIGTGANADTLNVPDLKRIDKDEWYPVTKQQITEFEKKLPKKLGKASTEDADSAEEFAKSKSAVYNALYGEYSLQYALIDNGKIEISGGAGYADIKNKKAPTKDSMYGIGSISKVFASTAVMQLVDKGKIDLDKPVVDYVKDFTMIDGRYKDITVRMLLNHSSGLMGSSFNNALLFNDSDTVNHDEFLKILKKQRLKADPGAYSVYCNDGFTLAEIVVERVTKQTFTDYVQKNISKPLKLTNTKTPQDSFDRKRMAKGYEDIDTEVPTESFNAIGAGGIYSSAEDLCRFGTTYMDNGNKNIISEESRKATMNRECDRGIWNKQDKELMNYGLGWDSVDLHPFSEYGIKALLKTGDTYYYHGSLIVLPELNMSVAVLSSAGSSSLNQILAQGILLRYLKEQGKISALPKEESFVSYINKAQAMPAQMKDYSGFYNYYGTSLQITITDDGILELKNAYGFEGQKYQYCGDGKFVDSYGTTLLSFITEKNGKTYLWSDTYSTLPTIGQMFIGTYQAEKINENPLTDKVKAAWQKRNNKIYFATNEKYSSMNYGKSGLLAGVALIDNLEGYMSDCKIVNANLAQGLEQIPVLYGRDLRDFEFYKKNGTEYLDVSTYTCISEDGIDNLSTKSKFTVTIGKDGQAKWYKIGNKSTDKKVKFTIPSKAAYAVYDEDLECVTHSYVSNKKTIILPKDGYIVFAGDKNKKFTVEHLEK